MPLAACCRVPAAPAVAAAPAMAAASSQSPLRRWEEVLATASACAGLPESCGQAAGGHRQCGERIWASVRGALQQSLALELCLAGKEQVAVRRAALHQLLQDEHRQHQRELRQLGRAFYVERL